MEAGWAEILRRKAVKVKAKLVAREKLHLVSAFTSVALALSMWWVIIHNQGRRTSVSSGLPNLTMT